MLRRFPLLALLGILILQPSLQGATVDGTSVRKLLETAKASTQKQQFYWTVKHILLPRPDAETVINRDIDKQIVALPQDTPKKYRDDLESERRYRLEQETKPRENSFSLFLQYIDPQNFYARQTFDSNAKAFDYYVSNGEGTRRCDTDNTTNVFNAPASSLEDLVPGNPLLVLNRLIDESANIKVLGQQGNRITVRMSKKELDSSAELQLQLPDLNILSVKYYRRSSLWLEMDLSYGGESGNRPNSVHVRRFMSFMKEPMFEDTWKLVSCVPFASPTINSPPVPKG
jgi:hypothetical protein